MASSDPGAPPSPPVLIRAAFAFYVLVLAVICLWQHRVLFAWPTGIVTGNLLASAIWAPLAVIHLDRLTRRHHRDQSLQAERHHAEHLALARAHHAEHMGALVQAGWADPGLAGR